MKTIFVEYNVYFMWIQKQQPEVFCKKVFLEISQNLQENTSATASFVINFAKFLGIPFSQNTASVDFTQVL